jgi:hypothetical protein
LPESNTLINFGDLSKPAVVLIEKISEAIGGFFLPFQIKRVAEAEVAAEKMRAEGQLVISDLQKRAFQRFVQEEAVKQKNIEDITHKAIENLKDSASPEKLENDWIANFFDKCRLISDEDMQQLWSKILAGEANSPGKISKRTINLLSSLDKTDANTFKKVCGFGWMLGEVVPFIDDIDNDIFVKNGVTFLELKHLDDIGLIRFDYLAGFIRKDLPQKFSILYYGQVVNLEFTSGMPAQISLGKVLLSKSGQELAPICGSRPVQGFKQYVMERWRQKGFIVSEPA